MSNSLYFAQLINSLPHDVCTSVLKEQAWRLMFSICHWTDSRCLQIILCLVSSHQKKSIIQRRKLKYSYLYFTCAVWMRGYIVHRSRNINGAGSEPRGRWVTRASSVNELGSWVHMCWRPMTQLGVLWINFHIESSVFLKRSLKCANLKHKYMLLKLSRNHGKCFKSRPEKDFFFPTGSA